MNGLTGAEAAERLEKYGPNEMKEKEKEHILIRFFRHFFDFLILLLMAAALVSAALGELVDAAMIFAIVLMHAILSFVQEYRAEKSFEALKRMVKRRAMAIRDGKVVMIDVRELVPGDVVILEAGDHVPADGSVIESFSLAADEAALTGESVPVHKGIKDEAFMGTVMVAGKGKMLIGKTGMATKMGNITAMVQEAQKEQTPIEKDLEKMGRDLGRACALRANIRRGAGTGIRAA
jgi:Ca2+-transporting ATPase